MRRANRNAAVEREAVFACHAYLNGSRDDVLLDEQEEQTQQAQPEEQHGEHDRVRRYPTLMVEVVANQECASCKRIASNWRDDPMLSAGDLTDLHQNRFRLRLSSAHVKSRPLVGRRTGSNHAPEHYSHEVGEEAASKHYSRDRHGLSLLSAARILDLSQRHESKSDGDG